MRIFILLLVFASSLHGYRPVPDPYLAGELSRAQGERRFIEGRIWVLEEASDRASPFARFERVGGELYLAPQVGRSEAHGTLRIDMGSWSSSYTTLDRRIKRDLLQLTRHPYATLKIYNIEGIVSKKAEPGRFVIGRLIADLELFDRIHSIDLPVRIHHFADGTLGVEPTSYLHLTADQLGIGSEARLLLAATDRLTSDRIRCLFRLEVNR